MGLSTTHLLILGLVVLLVFGGSGKISSIMGDFAKGIKSFKKGLSEDDDEKPMPPVIDHTGPKTPERWTDRRWTS